MNSFSMSIQLSFILLLTCLCMHACTSRPLRNKHSVKHVHLPAKALEKMKLHSITDLSLSRITKSDEAGDATERIAEKPKAFTKQVDQGMNKRKIPSAAQSHVSVSFRVPRKKQGSHEVIVSFDEGFQQSNIVEGLNGRARSVLGPDHQGNEETITSKDNGVVQDVMAMDYEPPHRKPPIHN